MIFIVQYIQKLCGWCACVQSNDIIMCCYEFVDYNIQQYYYNNCIYDIPNHSKTIIH